MKRAKATPPRQPTRHELMTDEEKLEHRKDETRRRLEKQKIQYKIDRAREYPPLQDQLDMIYNEGLDSWKAAIKAIKDKYPKPE